MKLGFEEKFVIMTSLLTMITVLIWDINETYMLFQRKYTGWVLMLNVYGLLGNDAYRISLQDNL